MNKVLNALFLVLACTVVARAQDAASDRWMVPEARVRRTVVCDPVTTGLPGEDVGVFTFYTGGLAQRGGKDVRVFAASGEVRLVPHRVVAEGPGDQLRIAFATPKGVRHYHVYYGDPKAGEPSSLLEIRRGLLYEVRTGEAAAAESVSSIERAFLRSPIQGAAFVDNIFFGFNPFGPSEGFISRFTGYLNIDKPGTYRIATTSDDCSFVLIDDQLVVKWGGVHGAVGDARHNAPVELSRGLHKLTYWHAQGGGGTVAEAAWLPPGDAKFVVIPREAFTRVAFARHGSIQIAGQRISPDFEAVRAGESFHDNLYPVRVEFKNQTCPAGNPSLKFTWDFGDGQQSRQADPSHVYLRHGVYTVRLTVTWGPQKAEAVNRVMVERNWWRQTAERLERVRDYAKQVSAYELTKLDAASLANAADLFASARDVGNRRRALEAIVFQAEGVLEAQMLQRAVELAELYGGDGRFDEAAKAYRRAEGKVSSAANKAAMALGTARILLNGQNRAMEAEREFRRVLKDYAKAPALTLREAHVGAGDAACRRGDAAVAAASYRAAEKIPIGGLAQANPTLRVSSLARYVEEYVRTGDFEAAAEYLSTWYREFPSQRLSGQIPLFEARLLYAQEKYDKVISAAGELVGVNPQSAFAAELLFLSAESSLKLDRTDDARRALAQIVDDYPEFQRHKEAAALLAKLGGPPPEPPAKP